MDDLGGDAGGGDGLWMLQNGYQLDEDLFGVFDNSFHTAPDGSGYAAQYQTFGTCRPAPSAPCEDDRSCDLNPLHLPLCAVAPRSDLKTGELHIVELIVSVVEKGKEKENENVNPITAVAATKSIIHTDSPSQDTISTCTLSIQTPSNQGHDLQIVQYDHSKPKKRVNQTKKVPRARRKEEGAKGLISRFAVLKTDPVWLAVPRGIYLEAVIMANTFIVSKDNHQKGWKGNHSWYRASIRSE